MSADTFVNPDRREWFDEQQKFARHFILQDEMQKMLAELQREALNQYIESEDKK